MSFADILASMGETGELGENPRLSLDTGEAKERRIRPGTGDAGEQFAPIRPAFAQPNPAPINEIRPIRPIRPGETEKHEPTKGIDGTHWHWIVEMPDRVIEAYFNPPADHAEILRQYPTATDLEPIPEPPKPVLSPSGKWYFIPRDPNKGEATP